MLKFISYKIYPSVQNTYDKYFSILKAGENDPRGDNDLALRETFAKDNTPTIFNKIPPEMFVLISQFLSSKEALEFRSSNKALFSLVTNHDILTFKIRNFFATVQLTSGKKVSIIVQNKLLEALYTFPLNINLLPKEKLIDSFPNFHYKFVDTSTIKKLDFVLKNSTEKLFWSKTSDNKLFLFET